MKTMENIVKVVSAALMIFIGYMNAHYTPVVWFLIAFVFYDVLVNIAKEGQQMPKLVSAAVTLGFPSLILQHLGDPNLMKWGVVLLTLVYIRVDAPLLFSQIKNIKWSKNPVQNAKDQQDVAAIAQLVMDYIDGKAAATLPQNAAAQAQIPAENVNITEATVNGAPGSDPTQNVRPAPSVNDTTVK